jgi:hypothetical protein
LLPSPALDLEACKQLVDFGFHRAEPNHCVEFVQRIIRGPLHRYAAASSGIHGQPSAVRTAGPDRHQSQRHGIGSDPCCRIAQSRRRRDARRDTEEFEGRHGSEEATKPIERSAGTEQKGADRRRRRADQDERNDKSDRESGLHEPLKDRTLGRAGK